VLAIIFW